MVFEGILFIFSLFSCSFLLFIGVYFIVTLSDLECDYLNAASCCSKLNRMVLPEIISVALPSVLLLLSWHWIVFLLNAPMLVYLIYRYLRIPKGNIGMYDPTEIHNRRLLQFHMKESMVKTANHVVIFFVYLYCTIYSLLTVNSEVQ